MEIATKRLEAPTSAEPRLLFVDALRGLAAMAVALFHFGIGHPAVPATSHSLARWCDAYEAVVAQGYLGVDVFFVISGFVIAYSLRNLVPTAGSAGNFLLRRSVRLDPPYLATIALALGCSLVARAIWQDSQTYLPSRWLEVPINMAYLHDLLGWHGILPVAWTLCIEIQFYLLFVLFWWLAGTVRGSEWVLKALLISMTAYSLLVHFCCLPDPRTGSFVPWWYLFQLGMLTCWTLTGRARSTWLVLCLLAVGGFLLAKPDPHTIAGLVTALAIFTVGKVGRLHDWLGSKPLQYLGRRSYSVYLIHLVVGARVTGLMGRLTHHAPSFSTALVTVALSLLATLVAAEMLYRLVEKPSVGLAKRLKLTRAPQRNHEGFAFARRVLRAAA